MVGQPEAWMAVAAVVGLAVTLATVGARVALLLGRMNDSVRSLNESMKAVLSHIGDHETRISRLEGHDDHRGTAA